MTMPTVSEFYGIQIVMRYREKHAPHFHVKYAEFGAQVVIADGSILGGRLPARAYHLVLEWLALHRVELSEDWELARRGEPVQAIAPLR
jgi:hypothetical protein